MFAVAHLDGATCADPAHLDLVDEAFVAPGSEAGYRMRRDLCAGCPVRQQCYDLAMAHGEWGVWGGTSPNQRTRRGSVRAERRVHSGHRVA